MGKRRQRGDELISGCPNCGHMQPHTGAGIGVCAAPECGCDDTRQPGIEMSQPSATPHDALCELSDGCICPWIATAGRPCDGCSCTCDIIAAVREHDVAAPPTNASTRQLERVSPEAFLKAMGYAFADIFLDEDVERLNEQAWHPGDLAHHFTVIAKSLSACSAMFQPGAPGKAR